MSISFDLTGRRFVVTGASSGIGRQTVVDLVAAGAHVLAVARRQDRLAELASQYPNRVTPAALDVCDFTALRTACSQFAKNGLISGSVHAAGINRFLPLKVFDWGEAEQILKTSVNAGIELIRVVTHRALSTVSSAHVQVASAMALVGQIGFAPYCAAKSALLGAVRCLALELAPRKSRINVVSPGWLTTEMTKDLVSYYPGGLDAVRAAHPLGLGETHDVTQAILFLLSDAARWITGANLVLDGGYTAR